MPMQPGDRLARTVTTGGQTFEIREQSDHPAGFYAYHARSGGPQHGLHAPLGGPRCFPTIDGALRAAQAHFEALAASGNCYDLVLCVPSAGGREHLAPRLDARGVARTTLCGRYVPDARQARLARIDGEAAVPAGSNRCASCVAAFAATAHETDRRGWVIRPAA